MPKLRDPVPEAQAFTDEWPAYLREARIAAAMSKWSIAQKMRMSASQVQDWESGKRVPHVWAQVRVCEILGLPVAAVFPRDDAELSLAEMYRKRRQESPEFDELLEKEHLRLNWTAATRS